MDLFLFTYDGFRIVQLIMTLVIFAFSSIFSVEYFNFDKKKIKMFGIFTLVVLISVVGVFLSASLLTLFVFFEMMSFSSYLWVAFNNDKKSKEASALYLTVSIITGMIMLMGIMFLNHQTNTLVIDEIYKSYVASSDKTSIFIAVALILVGFVAKAGLYPIHIWMSKSYTQAPAPATIMLSSVLSKAGVFGVIVVVSNIFSANQMFGDVFIVFALLTMIWGGLCAVNSDDFKTIMAFSSMSQLGFVFLGIAMQCLLEHNEIAVNGTTIYMLNHSIFKLVMFTLCGICFMKIGSTKLDDIKGIARGNRLFRIAFLVSACGLVGMPLTSGFLSKTLLHEALIEYAHHHNSVLFSIYEILFVVAGALTACYIAKITFTIFAKPEKNIKLNMSKFTRISLILVSCLIILVGVLPNLTADVIANFSVDIMRAKPMETLPNYFTYENIKGAFVSIIGGFILYFVVVKLVMPEIDRPICVPKAIHISSLYGYIYKAFMVIFDVYIFITEKLTNGLINVLTLFGLRPSKEIDVTKRISITYKFGESIDKILSALKIQTKKSYAKDLDDLEKESAIRRRMISASLSYGLLFSGIGLVAVLFYLLLA